ncbi:arginase [Bacillus sp. FSL W7-1360]
MKNKTISVIGVPMHFGQGIGGVDLGPQALRHAGFIDMLKTLYTTVIDKGDIVPSTASGKEEGLQNGRAIVETTNELRDQVYEMLTERTLPITLGGDHSIALGTLAGVVKHDPNVGVIWYDAHPDLNTDETSPSGNIHGMPLAAGLGIGHERLKSLFTGGFIKPENVVLIAARSIDEGEKKLIREHGIQTYTMPYINEKGMAAVMQEAIAYLRAKTNRVHISFDVDSLDAREVVGTGTRVAAGPTYRETELAFEMLAKSELITSIDVVEVNPLLDEQNKTAEIAVALTASLLGKTYL